MIYNRKACNKVKVKKLGGRLVRAIDWRIGEPSQKRQARYMGPPTQGCRGLTQAHDEQEIGTGRVKNHSNQINNGPGLTHSQPHRFGAVPPLATP